MKSKGKKFLSAVLVSSMVLTSSLGFMPRTAEAIDDASVYSYSFDYVDQLTQKGNKLIVLKTDENLTGYDTTQFSIEDNKAEIANIDLDAGNDEIRIEVAGIDPEIVDYKLVIKAGGLKFSGYSQLADITIDFKSYEITPGFKSIFKDEESTNNVFDNNALESIKIYVDSDYFTNVEAKTLSGSVNWTEFKISGTDAVDSVKVEVLGVLGDGTREVDSKTDDKFSATFAGISSTKDVEISAYDTNGRKLDSKIVRYNFGSSTGTNFDATNIKDFDSAGYTVRDLIDGTAGKTLDELLAGKSYGDLDSIKVYYKNIDTIIKVSTANELAGALAKLGSLSGQAVKIKLDADITVGSEVVFAHNASLMIDGNGHQLTGDVKLGNSSDAAKANKTVKLSNATVGGTLTVDVGENGDAYLTNVVLTSGNKILVKSGGYSSVKLFNTQATNMDIDNDGAKTHIIAGKDTVIQQTNLIGTYAAKMTSQDGGLFNVITLENDDELYLVGDANSPFKTVKIKEGITPRATIKLAADTTVENLQVNSPVTMTGKKSSKVVSATVSDTLGAGAVSYDGFIIENASGEKFTGTNTPGDGDTGTALEIPTTADNKIVLGGTVYGTHVTEGAIETGGKTLTLTLEEAASDRPLNIKWVDAPDASKVADLITAAGDTDAQTALKNTANFDVAVSSDKNTMTITWKTLDLNDLTDTLTVSIDPDKLVEALFDTRIENDKFTAAGTSYTAGFATLYKPSFYSNDGATGLLNKFSVFLDANDKIKDAQLVVTKDLKTVTMTGLDDTVEYKTSTTDWITAAANVNVVAVADADADTVLDLGASDNTVISLRSKGSNDSIDKFTLKENEVWFSTSSTSDAIATALNDPDVTRVYLAATDTPYDLENKTIVDRTGSDVELRVYPVGDKIAATMKLGTVEDVGDLDIGSNLTVSDTLAPTFTTATLASDNATPTLAKTGDTVTLTIVTSEATAEPVVTIDTKPTTIVAGVDAMHWTATRVLDGTENEGSLAFTLDATDLGGVAATQITVGTDAAIVTFDKTAPTTQDTVFAANKTYKGGASVTIVSSGQAADSVWFAPAGTTTFAAGSTMTKAASGTATAILAPADAGSYKLFVVDPTGNISAESTATLTVDNTAPTATTYTFAANAGAAETITILLSEALGDGSNAEMADGNNVKASVTLSADNAGASAVYKRDIDGVTAGNQPGILVTSSGDAQITNAVTVSLTGAGLPDIAGNAMADVTNQAVTE